MKQSQLFFSTLREAPADSEVISHQLMLRGGLIRQLAAGIYSYMPLGLRVLRNIERIVREEMNTAGAQELLMPIMQPAEVWKESGRYDVYGSELIRLIDRHQREFVLGPTHEEVITSIVRQEIKSYRKLPVTLYQIQTKFRDERRPRFGLLRTREFIMKDAYSFDESWKGLSALKTDFNYQKEPIEKIYTPNVKSIQQLVQYLNIDEKSIIKTLLFIADSRLVAVLVRGDFEINELKVKKYLNASSIEMAEAQAVASHISSVTGYVGPIGLSILTLVDNSVLAIRDGIAGANEQV